MADDAGTDWTVRGMTLSIETPEYYSAGENLPRYVVSVEGVDTASSVILNFIGSYEVVPNVTLSQDVDTSYNVRDTLEDYQVYKNVIRRHVSVRPFYNKLVYISSLPQFRRLCTRSVLQGARASGRWGYKDFLVKHQDKIKSVMRAVRAPLTSIAYELGGPGAGLLTEGGFSYLEGRGYARSRRPRAQYRVGFASGAEEGEERTPSRTREPKSIKIVPRDMKIGLEELALLPQHLVEELCKEAVAYDCELGEVYFGFHCFQEKIKPYLTGGRASGAEDLKEMEMLLENFSGAQLDVLRRLLGQKPAPQRGVQPEPNSIESRSVLQIYSTAPVVKQSRAFPASHVPSDIRVQAFPYILDNKGQIGYLSVTKKPIRGAEYLLLQLGDEKENFEVNLDVRFQDSDQFSDWLSQFLSQPYNKSTYISLHTPNNPQIRMHGTSYTAAYAACMYSLPNGYCLTGSAGHSVYEPFKAPGDLDKKAYISYKMLGAPLFVMGSWSDEVLFDLQSLTDVYAGQEIMVEDDGYTPKPQYGTSLESLMMIPGFMTVFEETFITPSEREQLESAELNPEQRRVVEKYMSDNTRRTRQAARQISRAVQNRDKKSGQLAQVVPGIEMVAYGDTIGETLKNPASAYYGTIASLTLDNTIEDLVEAALDLAETRPHDPTVQSFHRKLAADQSRFWVEGQPKQIAKRTALIASQVFSMLKGKLSAGEKKRRARGDVGPAQPIRIMRGFRGGAPVQDQGGVDLSNLFS